MWGMHPIFGLLEVLYEALKPVFGKPVAIVFVVFIGIILVGLVILALQYFLLNTSLQFEILEMTPNKAVFNICKSPSWLSLLIFLLFHQHLPENVVVDELLLTTYYNEKVLAETEFANFTVTKEPKSFSAYNFFQMNHHLKIPPSQTLKNFTAAIAALFSVSYPPGGTHKPTMDFESSPIDKSNLNFNVKLETKLLGFLPISLNRDFSFSDSDISTCK